eukprot:jgi/Mesvir1/28036/Mv24229-RA.1
MGWRHRLIKFFPCIALRFGQGVSTGEDIGQSYVDLDAVAQEPPRLIALFVGNQLTSHELAQAGRLPGEGSQQWSSAISPLKELMESANSSLTVSYVHGGGMAAQLLAALTKEAASTPAGVRPLGDVVAYGCKSGAEGVRFLGGLADAQAYLAQRAATRPAGATDVLMVCSQAPAAEHADELLLPGMPSSLGMAVKKEVEELRALHDTVAAAARPYVLVYASEDDGAGAARKRLVLERGNKVPCDALCLTKAHTLEGFAVGLVLVVTLLLGLCCMYQLDGPSRFETARD